MTRANYTSRSTRVTPRRRARKTGASSHAHAERRWHVVTAFAKAGGHAGRGLLSFSPCALNPDRKMSTKSLNRRWAVRAREGRKPFEVRGRSFSSCHDFTATGSFECRSLSGWLQQSPQFHTTITLQSCAAEASNLNHIYTLELQYFYIVNT